MNKIQKSLATLVMAGTPLFCFQASLYACATLRLVDIHQSQGKDKALESAIYLTDPIKNKVARTFLYGCRLAAEDYINRNR